MSMPSHAKTITRVSPSALRGPQESERHYVEVHVPLARRLLPRQDSMLAYSTLKVTRQLDAAGGWRRRPQAWRFIVLRFTDAEQTVFLDDTRWRTARDHANCLSHLRRTDVDEEVLLDRLAGQTTLQSYLVEIDETADGESDALAAAQRLAQALVQGAKEVDGIRKVVFNRVLSESETEALEEPGQLLTGARLPSTDKVAYVELVADDAWFAETLFAAPVVAAALVELERTARCAVYEVQERCGFDRRGAT